VLETALDEEMTEHLGRAKHKKSKDGRAANTRNGTTAKTVVTDSVGPVRIEVPRDRDVFCFNVCSTGSAVFFRSVG
jgi:transposase-like protein